MLALGIVRKLDDLGRVVIPKEVRRAQGWKSGQPLEMYTDKDGGLVIKAYSLGEADDAIRTLEAKRSFTDDPKKRKAYDLVIKDLQS